MIDRLVVSVVIGACNAGDDLQPALESILTQEGVDLELIVVDDGSTDSTGKELDAIAQRDPRIRVIHQENRGLTAALIRGCGAATGEFIARQDIGDRSLAGRLRKQVTVLRSNPGTVMATCGYRFLGPRGESLGESLPRHSAEEWTEILRSGDEERLHGPWHGSVMFRKAAYDVAGGYRPEFYFAQDLDLWTRLAAVGALEYVPEVLYQGGFNYGSISARFGAQQRQLRHLIAQATQRRNRGGSEADLLQQVATIRRPVNASDVSLASRVDADYFIGSCLAARRDPLARGYLRGVLRHRPFHGKAWAKLLWSYGAGGCGSR